MNKTSALLIISGLSLLLLGGWEPLSGQRALEEVTSLSFHGNRRFPDEVLAAAIITRETECRSFVFLPFCWAGADFFTQPFYLLPREFDRDQTRIRLFYYQRGYRQTVVESEVERPSPGEMKIRFQVEEGEPVRVVGLDFTGLEEVSDSSVVADLPILVDDPLNAIVLEATRDTLISRLRERGFARAEVFLNYLIPPDSPLGASVTFDLYPGSLAHVGPVTVVGNTTVQENVVRRMLPLREGDIYNQELLHVGQRNLYNLDIFTLANIIPDTTHVPDTVVPLLVQVGEGDAHRVRAGAGFSTSDCVNTEVRWVSRNYFGGARRLQFTGRVSKILAPIFESTMCPQAGTGEYGELNWLVSAEFTQPWLFSPRNSFSATLFGERQSVPDVFVRQALGMNVGITHQLAVSTPLTFSVRPQLSELHAAEIFFCSNYLMCTPEDIAILQRANWLSPIGLRFVQDRRNQALSPTRGHSLIVDLEHASSWTGSDFRYSRLMAEGSWYKQGRNRRIVAARIRGGWVNSGEFRDLVSSNASDEIIHPEKRLYGGGSNGVRGFSQNRLGPQVLHLRKVQPLLESRGDESNPLPPACVPAEILDLSCDASILDDRSFYPRPTGGIAQLEGSVEFRFPLSGALWEGATFLDFGQVWEDTDGISLADLELTPGFGVRYFSPIGPIRVDVAYRFDSGRDLRVVTSQIRDFDPLVDKPNDRLEGPGGPMDFVTSDDLAIFTTGVRWGDEGTWSLRRFQIHLSIGQAF